MAEQFQMDQERLQQVVKSLGQVSSDFENALDKLKSTLAQHGPCWGNDDTTGKPFGEKYQKPAQECQDNSDSLSQQITQAASSMNGSANSLGDTDQQNAQYLRRTLPQSE